jgi:large subunit ribosomal protein L21
MHAVFKIGGKQYRVAPGDEVKVEKLPGKEGDSVAFDNVLMTSDVEQVSVGKPYLENVKVMGKITRQGKHGKVVVFKFRRRKGYRKKTGHRQAFTHVKIEGIEAGAQSEEQRA